MHRKATKTRHAASLRKLHGNSSRVTNKRQNVERGHARVGRTRKMHRNATKTGHAATLRCYVEFILLPICWIQLDVQTNRSDGLFTAKDPVVKPGLPLVCFQTCLPTLS